MEGKTQLTIFQKSFLAVWVIAILVSFINDILEFGHVIKQGLYSIAFNDGLKQLVLNCFYTYISLLLFQLLYQQKDRFVNLLSIDGIKKVSRILSVLVSLLITKVVFNFIIVKYVIPKAADASIAKGLGYDVGMKLLKWQSHKDLIIAIAIVWVFLLVLEHAQKLKQEQDLMI